jgi:hypothetical protein
MQEADDLDVVAAHLVEDQVVWEPLRRPRSDALGTRGSELSGTARQRVLQEGATAPPTTSTAASAGFA